MKTCQDTKYQGRCRDWSKTERISNYLISRCMGVFRCFRLTKKSGGENVIDIGIDVHKKRCVATLKRGDSNDIIEQTAFYNNSTGIDRFIEHIKEFHDDAMAVCESTGNYWIRLHDTLEENGINTLIANPLKTKIIAQARLKDDKIDSNALADLLRADLVYESFVPDREHREFRQLVRTRLDMVTQRTMCKNKIHAILAKYEHRCPVTKTFSDKGIQWLKEIELSWIDRMQ